MSKKSAGKKSPRGDALFEVFVRPRAGLAYRHVGSVRAADAEMALQNARDVYTRRREGVGVWVAPSAAITASPPEDKETLFAADKPYRHPAFYRVPDGVAHM